MRGEVFDSSFHFIQARTRSCWRGIACLSQVAESQEMEEDLEETHMPPPFGDVPSLTYPL